MVLRNGRLIFLLPHLSSFSTGRLPSFRKVRGLARPLYTFLSPFKPTNLPTNSTSALRETIGQSATYQLSFQAGDPNCRWSRKTINNVQPRDEQIYTKGSGRTWRKFRYDRWPYVQSQELGAEVNMGSWGLRLLPPRLPYCPYSSNCLQLQPCNLGITAISPYVQSAEPVGFTPRTRVALERLLSAVRCN